MNSIILYRSATWISIDRPRLQLVRSYGAFTWARALRTAANALLTSALKTRGTLASILWGKWEVAQSHRRYHIQMQHRYPKKIGVGGVFQPLLHFSH